MASRALIFFVKYPTPGKVKTRLAAEVGASQAAEIYRTLVAAICARLPRDLPVIAQFDPPEQRRDVETWLQPLLPGAHFSPQAAGDLGDRLRHAFDEAFAAGHRRVAVIGSDCAEIGDALFEQAFASLDTHDCAVGPSEDGGYYLLALKAPQPALFENIAWSSADTLTQTLERAGAARLSVALLPPRRDVDTESDWKIARQFLASTSATGR